MARRQLRKRPLSQSCYKLKIRAMVSLAAQAREPAFRLPPQHRARGWLGTARSSMPDIGEYRAQTVPADPAVTASHGGDPLVFVRYLDIVVVVLAAPFVLLLGAPVLGYVVGAAAWIIQRVAAVTIERRAERAGDVKTALGLNMASLVLRAWLIGLTILAVGLIADREDGLAAGITVLVAFTVYFATSLIIRPLERKSSRP